MHVGATVLAVAGVWSITASATGRVAGTGIVGSANCVALHTVIPVPAVHTLTVTLVHVSIVTAGVAVSRVWTTTSTATDWMTVSNEASEVVVVSKITIEEMVICGVHMPNIGVLGGRVGFGVWVSTVEASVIAVVSSIKAGIVSVVTAVITTVVCLVASIISSIIPGIWGTIAIVRTIWRLHVIVEAVCEVSGAITVIVVPISVVVIGTGVIVVVVLVPVVVV